MSVPWATPWRGAWLAGLATILALVLSTSAAQAAVTSPVTTVADTVAADGSCSLREAIQAANTNLTVNECAHNGVEGDTITFNIAGAGPHIVNVVAGGLPTITAPVAMNGASEPNFAVGAPVMVLNGAAAGAGTDGFSLSGAATGSTIRGFVIQNFSGDGISTDAAITIEGSFIGTTVTGNAAASNGLGIRLNGGNSLIGGPALSARNIVSANVNNGIRVEAGASGSLIQNNYIGLNVTGTADLGNGIAVAPPNEAGILLFGPSTRIGGTGAGQGNVISGNSGTGVNVQAGANNTVVEGNIIALNAAGSAAILNGQDGVQVTSALNVLIGGIANTTPGGACTGACNVISGNQDTGITVAGGSSGAQILGNFIGLDITGTLERANQTEGISLFGATNAVIGGTTPGARNVISGHLFNGVQLRASTLTSTVAGNFIGTNSAGTAALSNGGSGVHISETSVGNTVGGTTGLTPGACTGSCNLIFGNDSRGVTITGAGVTGNAVWGNSIDQNGGLGIDLGADSVTPNDADDGDAGPNNLQNFPVLTTAQTDGAVTQVIGSLTSTANTNGFKIEFFSSPACDALGNGEGSVFLGSTTVHTTGNVGAFDVNTLPATTVGHVITATATSPTNNTSELSLCQPIVPAAAGAITVNPTAGLTTSEAGVQANFTVVLGTAPIANVTIPIISSDTTEGTVPVASLVFTSANALVPQQVTITGVDDGIVDGPVAYQIVLGLATSADVAYNGRDPANIAVTNQDNDTTAPTAPPAAAPVAPDVVYDPNNDDEEDEQEQETKDERRQRARTNQGNRDDEHTEGNVVELRCGAPIPTVVIANRDGNVEVQLVKGAANTCTDIAVGDYLEVDGEKQHELLFQAHAIDVHRKR